MRDLASVFFRRQPHRPFKKIRETFFYLKLYERRKQKCGNILFLSRLKILNRSDEWFRRKCAK